MEAVRYLHRRGIGHRDVRAEQCQFTSEAAKVLKLTELTHCTTYRTRTGRYHQPPQPTGEKCNRRPEKLCLNFIQN